eukprot:m.225504 g.225504  ORF g.225504 m.225504 type:complete len:514 (+) comp10835_c2_seq10:537-2078(+)
MNSASCARRLRRQSASLHASGSVAHRKLRPSKACARPVASSRRSSTCFRSATQISSALFVAHRLSTILTLPFVCRRELRDVQASNEALQRQQAREAAAGKDELRTVRLQLRETQEKLVAAAVLQEQAQQQVQEHASRVSLAQAQITELEARNEELRSKWREAQEEKETVAAAQATRSASLEQILLQCEADMQRVQTEFLRRNTELESAQQRAASLEKKCDELERKLQQEKAHSEVTLQELQQKLEALQKQQQARESSEAADQRIRGQLESDLRKAREQVRAEQDRGDELHAALSQLQGEMERFVALEAKCGKLEKLHDAHGQEVQQLHALITSLKASKAESDARHEVEAARLRAQLGEMQTNAAQEQSNRITSIESNRKLTAELHESTTLCTRQARRIAELEAELAQSEYATRNLRQGIGLLQRQAGTMADVELPLGADLGYTSFRLAQEGWTRDPLPEHSRIADASLALSESTRSLPAEGQPDYKQLLARLRDNLSSELTQVQAHLARSTRA